MKQIITLNFLLLIVNSLTAQTETFDAVGIGITPNFPLHIYENLGQGQSLMIDADVDANPNIYFKNNGQPVANLRYNDSGNDHFQIQVGNSLIPSLNISMDGKVGIGNIEPSNALDVNGDVFVTQRLLGSSFTIDLDGGSSLYPKRITSQKVGGSATIEFQTYNELNDRLQTRFLLRGKDNNDIEFYDNEENEFVHFDGDTKNVGIGNTNPSEKLVVDGTILAEEVKVQNVPSSDYVFEPNYKLRPIEDVEVFVKENKHLPDIPSAEEGGGVDAVCD